MFPSGENLRVADQGREAPCVASAPAGGLACKPCPLLRPACGCAEASLVELDPLVVTLRQKVCCRESGQCGGGQLPEGGAGVFAALPLGHLSPEALHARHSLPCTTGCLLQVQRVDAEILEAVRVQSSSGARAREELAGARAAIEDLFARIHEIQRKAEQSELMVQEICRDIKKLDYAKKHLTATITALRRLSMLVNAVDQLQLAVERHEYAEAAHLLEAVQQLSSHFQSYVHIPKVAELKGRLTALERSLQINTMREFELLGEETPSPLLLERLRSCCMVVEALGYQARDELIDSVCKREMGVYTQIFATIGDTARLERTANRYKWLLKRLEARKDIWAIFPPSWHVPQLLCIMFCNISKTMLAEILDLKLPQQVDNLLKAVEATNIFESEMARRFEGAVDREPSSSEDAEVGADGGAATADDSTPASRVRQRYEKLAREKQRTAEGESPERRKEQHATSVAVAKTNFKGSISSVFVPYLGVYFEQVERDLMAALERLMREESWQPLSGDLRVLRSSNELVEALKAEMRDCTGRVTRGRPLLELAAVFQRVYRAYAARLVARLPKPSSGSLGAAAVLGASDWYVRLSDDDIGVVCLIASTAEHCQEMVRQLARALAAKLEPRELASRVDMSEEEDEFQTVTTQCLASLLLGIETKLEGALSAMARINWAGMEMAGDQSEYVGSFRRVLLDVGARLGPAMPPNYFRFFCDRLLRSFAPRFYENVFRCRKISDIGCQQASRMRLDTEVIKGQLSDLAKAGGQLDVAGVQSFAADVNAQLGRAEAVLKVVGSPPDGMVDTFFELLPHGSPSDFQRMADLKVLKRGEYQAVLEQFNRRMGRPLLSGDGVAVRSAASGFSLPQMQMPRLQSGTSNAAAKAAQDVAARLGKLNPNLTAAKASAAAAGESMRETMRGLKSKSLRFMQRD
ncbi:hypothetical protein CHLNCDRAFT_23940 [Chlorella variabilis]|uniref:Vps53 N-terminal domain-containing protein n=1 Tax=Chlorella variabilis TaxID=554065 RepID=E1ZH91_CHLVA|nr:hypothetical protein CHLNCDRAFT_23940 [Chlorella variabilis]EFN54878.1 hypothetical protein CHLNCDRAFT_23940 [Chlorella variabilis]|eukprot:XP_005846980.1 hypothetical protein CHLNCDRAFT_23940 [Chlorella variabilis]